MSWFDVDKDGLRQLLEGKDKSFIIRELVQNAWDEVGVTQCDVILKSVGGGKAVLQVSDDAPEGFYDLRHAYTLYAKTRKRAVTDKRGRFNLGEKQVLALCDEAEVTTTTGRVQFLKGGRRMESQESCLPYGSVFRAHLPMTVAEMRDAVRAAMTFIPPVLIATTINGKRLPTRLPLEKVEATLATEAEDDEGRYRTTRRKTEVHVYEPKAGETPMIYEMGLPIIEIEGRWHYDVQQRVPLTSDRENVKPAFLQDVHAEVLNKLALCLTRSDASAGWVASAIEDDRVEKDALETVLHRRFGEKLVTRSVNDKEANHTAQAAGYEVLAGGSLSGRAWENVKKHGLVEPASKAFPTAHPEFGGGEDATIPESKWTKGMHHVAEYTEAVARELVGGAVVKIVSDGFNRFGAWYGGKTLTYNLRVLGHRFFDQFPNDLDWVNSTIIHEIAHEYEGNHLSEKYHRALCDLGAQLVSLALSSPRLFKVRKTKVRKST